MRRRVRISRADFDELIARGTTAGPGEPIPSIWQGEIPDPELVAHD
jgi:hypothetical protein